MPAIPAPSVVVDTNVALAWLLFEDPACAVLGEAIVSARLRWVATASMRQELEHVLGRPLAQGRRRSAANVLDRWDRNVCLVEPVPQAIFPTLTCTDTDDQKFVDLALQQRASLLVSRDRAVLKLRRRAALHGLAIVAAFEPSHLR